MDKFNLLAAIGRWLTASLNGEDYTVGVQKKITPRKFLGVTLWEHTGSNRGPSACKADALNQLSYAPLFIGSAKIGAEPYPPKKSLGLTRINSAKVPVNGTAGCRTQIIPQYGRSSICITGIWLYNHPFPICFPY